MAMRVPRERRRPVPAAAAMPRDSTTCTTPACRRDRAPRPRRAEPLHPERGRRLWGSPATASPPARCHFCRCGPAR